jgi:hypothetical protein
MAPSWISTSKVLPGDLKLRKWPASSRWPVDETGRNSVSPSIRPSRITCQVDMRGSSGGEMGSGEIVRFSAPLHYASH